ncbi:DNA repair protein RadA [Pelotomaculum isophthalicicum JI]|uniref:DNA repair protein RadA n=1 Tax=Pelotomaculum isophthalicicum JI TaxID=947010 RepID=A0A9X4JV25_9FIRM|nr:DNA repair protein RadA [Pelotomaculum isophthalicicum]MDF9407511.1 DNA repair protein RadA [Pelotomaculum isophthalicicum JI]
MRAKSFFQCSVCGHQSTRWLGRCPGCGAWNSLVEELGSRQIAGRTPGREVIPSPVTEIPALGEERLPVGIDELDRVLGGGVVPGSLILVGGDPGIGKSTLLLQIAYRFSDRLQVLYVSGEESVRQIRIRADRLGALSPNLLLVAETDIDLIERHLNDVNPPVAIIDSIQTMFKNDLGSVPGSVGQVRECTAQLMRLAKATGISVFLVGHVTKEGLLAGPRVLEHMVDTVLYLEGDRHQSFRILRGVKNRFGSTNEIGVFEMRGQGLVEVANPSLLFLNQYPGESVPGTAVVSSLEGSRPLLVEIQALVSPAGYGVPRRMTAGVDHNRVALIAAVLEKRIGLNLGSNDIYVNAVGGVKLDEPAVDLGIALALTSSFRDVPVESGLAAAGEIGLAGELRPVPGAAKRVNEAFKLGFNRFLLSAQSEIQNKTEAEVLRAVTLAEALEVAIKL